MFQFFPKSEQASKRQVIVVLFGIFLIGQFVLFAIPRSSSGYPSPRTQQAIQAHERDSETAQMAAIAEARRLDMIDAHREEVAKGMLLVGVDIVVIYLFWKYGKRYTVA